MFHLIVQVAKWAKLKLCPFPHMMILPLPVLIIHIDVWGIAPTICHSHHKYLALLLIITTSLHGFLFCMLNLMSLIPFFFFFKSHLVETQFFKKMKILRSNSGENMFLLSSRGFCNLRESYFRGLVSTVLPKKMGWLKGKFTIYLMSFKPRILPHPPSS